MARRRRAQPEEVQDLNLAPIMNMVMILIPLLLLSTVFIKAGVVNISSPRNAQSTTQENEEQEEDEPVPRVVIYISDDGFRVGDQRNLPSFQPFTQPVAGCDGAAAAGEPQGNLQPHDMANIPATVCNRRDADASASLLDRLDFAGLYNHLVRIRMQPAWFDRFGEENNAVISLLGDPEIPFEVLIATMDTARYFLQSEGAGLTAPTAASTVEAYLLGSGGNATAEDLGNAEYIRNEEEEGSAKFVELFPDPVLLLPRPNAG